MSSTRRHFIQTSLAAPALAAQVRTSPNDRIQIALIGAGGMGTGDAESALAQSGVELVAVSDVYDGRLVRARERLGGGIFTTRDYREILSKPDIDAVIVATPDHWHAQIAIDAMNHGKDVYVEKPMVQKVEDGRRVAEAQKKTGRILQVGSQRVSSIVYEKAKELLKQGSIGQVNMIEAWWDRNSAIGAWQYSIPPDSSQQTIDWDRFLGSAPKRPFEPVRLFRWRNYRDYGTGVAGDLFVHLFSGMHYIVGSVGPTRVFATGGLRFWKDGRDVPDVMLGLYDYPATSNHPAFNLALRVNFVNGAGETSGFRFVGSEGILTVGNGVTVSKQPRQAEPGYTIDTFPKAVQQEFLKQYREKYPQQRATADAIRPKSEDQYLPPRGYNDHLDHHRVFIEAVRSRKPVTEDAVFGLRAAGPALLSNMSYFEQRVVNLGPGDNDGHERVVMQSANNNVQIALIGAGGMGMGDTRAALQIPGVKLIAAADIYDSRLQRARELWGDQIFTTRDHREILNRKDVDAVIIATPDHWHAQITREALMAGKDVYCEKPMVQQVEEGKPVIEAQQKSGRILQIGSQYASSMLFHKANEVLKSGGIGELNMVEAVLDRNTPIGAWQYSIPPNASPANIDWDRFLGKAPKRPFDPVRLFRWRNYRDYGTGVAGDLFVHLLTGLHVATGSIGPNRIFAVGGTRHWNDGRDVVDVMLATMDYPGFTLALRVNLAAGAVTEKFEFRFVGSEGVMTVDMTQLTLSKTPREKEPGFTIGTFSKAVQEQFMREYRAKYPPSESIEPTTETKYRTPSGYSAHLEHHRNFYQAVRTRKPFFEDGVFGFRAAGPSLLTNTSLYESRVCKWDAEKMTA